MKKIKYFFILNLMFNLNSYAIQNNIIQATDNRPPMLIASNKEWDDEMDDAKWGNNWPSKHQSSSEIKHFNGPTDIKSMDFNSEDVDVNGILSAESSNFNSLNVNGPTKLIRTTVKNKFTINGPLWTEECSIKGVLFINGPLKAENSSFKDISIAAKKIFLTHSSINDLRVRNESENEGVQKVFLRHTTVHGDIEFDSGKGEVFMDEKSKIIGKIKGGVLKVKTNSDS